MPELANNAKNIRDARVQCPYKVPAQSDPQEAEVSRLGFEMANKVFPQVDPRPAPAALAGNNDGNSRKIIREPSPIDSMWLYNQRGAVSTP
ncbi:hypothetical protein QCA50_007833 [Cerrena zonata]|uniref:Uncharacterized protein n=1 Tax=Cerrena zonata TaxID=2478898 RepID=A0AAW0GGR2_9APHY